MKYVVALSAPVCGKPAVAAPISAGVAPAGKNWISPLRSADPSTSDETGAVMPPRSSLLQCVRLTRKPGVFAGVMSIPRLHVSPVCGFSVPLPPVRRSPVTLFSVQVVDPGGQPGIPIADGKLAVENVGAPPCSPWPETPENPDSPVKPTEFEPRLVKAGATKASA